MLNQVILVGRLSHDLELKDTKENKKELDIVLTISRSFKNSDGVYETDIINCKVYDDMASNVVECCKKGDIIGVKGHLQMIDNNMLVIAEKVTFLSSKSSN